MDKMEEKVLCIKRDDLPKEWLMCKGYIPDINICYFDNFTPWLIQRSVCENDPQFQQLIPYCIIERDKKILVYERKATEKRLHGLLSCGIGGHISEEDYSEDKKISDIILYSLKRELLEEILYKGNSHPHFQGLINEETSPVGKVHLGLVYVLDVHDITPQEELFMARWMDIDEIYSQIETFELWSQLALKLI
ncbi:MAG: phosphoesterase [Desulfobacterales bacterium]|nr:phosphoesterase [Desulfobacterales bacterium]